MSPAIAARFPWYIALFRGRQDARNIHFLCLCAFLGFTIVKYIRAIEFIDDYTQLGGGQGGWREDHQYYSQEAGI
jgi:hypothetical protein